MDFLTLSLGLSLHLGLENNYNSFHPHVRYQNENLISGVYFNSVSEISLYMGKRFEYSDLGLEYGAATGYYDYPITPFVRATYKEFFIAPAKEKGDGKVGIVIGTELKF
jgi:hypothetical protein